MLVGDVFGGCGFQKNVIACIYILMAITREIHVHVLGTKKK